ncbi:MAG: ABC transporter substrate-binding protein [Ignavibacteria bacterium]|nr:ABC transporter substrate-binding protein [Ignavibacteria bacterium]
MINFPYYSSLLRSSVVTANVIILLSLLLSCGKQQPSENQQFSITDDLGNVIELQKKPEKIISLAPNITEAIFSIGADSLLIGVTSYCNYPVEAKTKTVIGGMLDPNIEIITSLKPDLILLTVEGNSQASYQALMNAGFKIFITNPRDLSGIKKMLRDFGKICRKENNSQSVINKIDSSEKSFLEITDKINPKPEALILVSINPLITVNKTTYINQVINLSGFKNIYEDEPMPYPTINYEDVILKNPDYVILTSELTDEKGNYLKELGKYLNTTNAFRNNKIISVNADLISRPGPRIIQAIESLISSHN